MLKNLKILREMMGVSQRQLAEVVGVSQQSINKYENHDVEPDISTLISIADYFGTSVDYLIGNTAIQRRIEKTHPSDLNECELSLVDGFRQLTMKQRKSILSIIENYLEK